MQIKKDVDKIVTCTGYGAIVGFFAGRAMDYRYPRQGGCAYICFDIPPDIITIPLGVAGGFLAGVLWAMASEVGDLCKNEETRHNHLRMA